MIGHPLFVAIDVSQIIPIVIVLFGIISWIMNALKDKKQEAERPVRRARAPRNDSLQSEIDIFIQEVTEQKGKQAPPQRQRQPTVPVQPALRTPVRTLVKAESGTPRKTEQPKPKHKTPGEDIASRKGPGSLKLGQDLTRHLEQHMMSNSITQASEQRLGHHVNESVMEHLGKSSTSQEGVHVASTGSPMIDEVRRMLSHPSSMGQAVLLNEILSPPRSKHR